MFGFHKSTNDHIHVVELCSGHNEGKSTNEIQKHENIS